VPEPLRDRLLEAVVTRLKGLTGTRPGGWRYPRDPIVTRTWTGIEQATQFPVLIVSVGSGSRPRIVATVGGQAMVEDRLHAVIYGYVRSEGGTPASRWLLRLQTDVIDTLYAEQTLGGLARGVEFLEDETDDGVLEPLGAFAQHVAILADETKTVG